MSKATCLYCKFDIRNFRCETWRAEVKQLVKASTLQSQPIGPLRCCLHAYLSISIAVESSQVGQVESPVKAECRLILQKVLKPMLWRFRQNLQSQSSSIPAETLGHERYTTLTPDNMHGRCRI